ncbi:MAG: peptidase U32 family protein, partial [Candidatus Woesearchaeota archaeon]
MPSPARKPELLSPASDFTSLRAAIDAGADAVYFGVKGLNMRATAKNFTAAQLDRAVRQCHDNDARAYLTLNNIVYSKELGKVRKIVSEAKKAGIDAIICWDPAVIGEARKAGIPVHISTQASVSNPDSAMFYKRLGAERIIPARELNLNQIKEMRKKAKIEVECFVHGAMCVSISGRCFMSQHIFGRSANRGDCLQPCRRKYRVKLEDVEEGHELELGEDHVMSPRDLCTLPFIEKLISAGIDAFKIEGRARSPEYVKTVTECYRSAIDAYSEGRLTRELKSDLMRKLGTVYNREFSPGFYLGKPVREWASPETKATEKKAYIGKVKNYYPKQSVAVVKL